MGEARDQVPDPQLLSSAGPTILSSAGSTSNKYRNLEPNTLLSLHWIFLFLWLVYGAVEGVAVRRCSAECWTPGLIIGKFGVYYSDEQSG